MGTCLEPGPGLQEGEVSSCLGEVDSCLGPEPRRQDDEVGTGEL